MCLCWWWVNMCWLAGQTLLPWGVCDRLRWFTYFRIPHVQLALKQYTRPFLLERRGWPVRLSYPWRSSRCKCLINEGIHLWVLKIVTDGQTDSLTNLIKCVVICRSYSYAFWSTSLWAPVILHCWRSREDSQLEFSFYTAIESDKSCNLLDCLSSFAIPHYTEYCSA